VPGDGVDGYAREAIVRPATWFTHAPRHLDHAESATLTTAGLTAWRALVGDGRLKAGDTVLALGTGGVSIFALQLAKAMGARVISTTSGAAKAERLRALGADEVVNYVEIPEWGRHVRKALTGGAGVDCVVEVGGPATVGESLRAVRPGGEVVLIGFLSEANPGSIAALNEIAAARGQSLAQMAIAWVLRGGRVTSALIGASRPEQVTDCVAALKNPEFSAEELAAIDRHAVDGGINIWAASAER